MAEDLQYSVGVSVDDSDLQGFDDQLNNLGDIFPEIEARAASFGEKVKSIFSSLIPSLRGVQAEADATAAAIEDSLSGITPDRGLIEGLEDDLSKLKAMQKQAFTIEDAKKYQVQINAVEEQIKGVQTQLGKVANEGKTAFGRVKDSFGGLTDSIKGGDIGGALSGALGGFAGGAAVQAGLQAFNFIKDKAAEADAAADGMAIALAKAGLSADEAEAEINRAAKAASRIGNEFAMSTVDVTKLQATIVGFGNITGEQLDQLTEISIGAANAMGMSADGVAKLIAKGADPEQEASLKKLGIIFDKNSTSAERMALVQKKLGPAIQATKDSTNDAFGSFDRLTNSFNDAIIGVASVVFEALKPAFDVLILALDPVIWALGAVVDVLGVFQSIAGFIFNIISKLVGAFVKWLTNLGFVRAAIDLVKDAIAGVTAFFGNLIDTISNGADALLSLVGATDDYADSAKNAGEIAAKAHEDAAAAAEEHKKIIEGIVEGYNNQTAAAKASAESASTVMSHIQQVLEAGGQQVNGQFVALTASERVIWETRLKQYKDYGTAQAKEFKKNEARLKANNVAIGLEEEKATDNNESELAKRLAAIDAAMKKREALTIGSIQKTTETAQQEFVAGLRETAELSKKEEKAIAVQQLADKEKLLEDMQQLVKRNADGTVISLTVGSKPGEEKKDLADMQKRLADLQLAIAQDKLNIVKIIPQLNPSDFKKLIDDYRQQYIAFLESIQGASRFGIVAELDVLNLKLTAAKTSVVNLRDEISKEDGTSALLTQLNEIVDATGNIKPDIDITAALGKLQQLQLEAAKLNGSAKFAELISNLLPQIQALASAQISIDNSVTTSALTNAKTHFDRLKEYRDAEIEALKKTGATEQELNELRKQSLEELLQSRLEVAGQNFELQQAAWNDYYDELEAMDQEATDQQIANLQTVRGWVENVLTASFSKAFGDIKKNFFDGFRKEIGAADNAFAEFAASLLEEITNLLLAVAAKAALIALLDAIMPGSGQGAGLALSAFAGGGVVDTPTVAMLGEGFRKEMIMPEVEVDKVLADKITNAQEKGTLGGYDAIKMAFSDAMEENPIRGQLGGYEIDLVSRRQRQRMKARS